jgi:hypothetical protein
MLCGGFRLVSCAGPGRTRQSPAMALPGFGVSKGSKLFLIRALSRCAAAVLLARAVQLCFLRSCVAAAAVLL